MMAKQIIPRSRDPPGARRAAGPERDSSPVQGPSLSSGDAAGTRSSPPAKEARASPGPQPAPPGRAACPPEAHRHRAAPLRSRRASPCADPNRGGSPCSPPSSGQRQSCSAGSPAHRQQEVTRGPGPNNTGRAAGRPQLPGQPELRTSERPHASSGLRLFRLCSPHLLK